MKSLKKTKVSNGIYWVEIPKADLRILCGCPADSVKHLRKLKLIENKQVDGTAFQTGPNVILLSEVLIQNGQFANLAEFPVLQMLYLQGLLIPNHPNNNGTKPLLMGVESEIASQKEYIYRGNYGLDSIEELKEAGLSDEEATKEMRLKLRFAFGKIRKTEELLDTFIVSSQMKEIRNGVRIGRVGFNLYEIAYENEHLFVDLNLGADESYMPSYDLDYQQVQREEFAVVHSGEGDGWNPNSPCMGSILVHKGKIYLIDAGPNISYTLMALGIGINEVEGIFHTHAHDDHFAGLPTLLVTQNRIKYYSTPPVRDAVIKKMCSLMSISEDKFSLYFETHNLDYDQWNDVDGLEVKPLHTAHPIETCLYLFRASDAQKQHTYAHFADIVSLDVLKEMVTDDPTQPGLSETFYKKIETNYLLPADLKKLDVGGGMIHGQPGDFAEDSSKKVFSHLGRTLTAEEATLGDAVKFGTVNVMIPAKQNYLEQITRYYVDQLFPEVSAEDKELLWNNPIVQFDEGAKLLEVGKTIEHVYLILTGTITYTQIVTENQLNTQGIIGKLVSVFLKKANLVGDQVRFSMSAGNIVGDFTLFYQPDSFADYQAISKVHALQIPSGVFLEFCQKNKLNVKISEAQHKDLFFLKAVTVFKNLETTVHSLEKILQALQVINYNQAETMTPLGGTAKDLLILKEGKAEIVYEGKRIYQLMPGDFFGEEPYVYGRANLFEVKALRPCEAFLLPYEFLQEIPAIHWQILSLSTQRMNDISNSLSLKNLP